MNLAKKKSLAARAFGVGKSRVVFAKSRLNEIKEAITKQDVRDLKKDGAITILEIKGRKTKPAGKLRKQLYHIKNSGEIAKEDYKDARKKIRNRFFKSKSHLKEHLEIIKK